MGAQDNETDLFIREDRCEAQGLACSVYPFLTAIDGDKDVKRGGPVSRCVDVGEDAREYFCLLLFSVCLSLKMQESDTESKIRTIRHAQFLLHLHGSLVR